MASKREDVTMKSTESTYRFRTRKNKSNTKDRLVLRKYDPIVRKHTEFKESK